MKNTFTLTSLTCLIIATQSSWAMEKETFKVLEEFTKAGLSINDLKELAEESVEYDKYWERIASRLDKGFPFDMDKAYREDVAKLNAKNQALFAAITSGTTEAVRKAIKDGANVEIKLEKTKLTPVGYAIQELRPDVVEILIQAGGDPNIIDAYNILAPMGLMWYGQVKKQVDLNNVLEKYHSTGIYDLYGIHTVAMDFEKQSKLAVPAPVAVAKAQPARPIVPLPAVAVAKALPAKPVIAPSIAATPSNLDRILADGETQLTAAVQEARDNKAAALPKVKSLLAQRANVNAKNASGWTPLMFAVSIRDAKDLVELLLSAGADPSLANNAGLTALGAAQRFTGQEYREMLEKNVSPQPAVAVRAQPPVPSRAPVAEVKAPQAKPIVAPSTTVTSSNLDRILEDGETQLTAAVQEARDNKAAALPKIKSLLAQRANVNAKNASGWTPLMWAVSIRDAKDLVELLLNAGADPALANNAGMTALMAAKNFTGKEYVEMLEKKMGLNP